MSSPLLEYSPMLRRIWSQTKQAFRSGKSCCERLLDLTQYIEDGFEKKMINGTVFVDLTVVYDTVDHMILLFKVANIIRNKQIVNIIQSLLKNRSFFVEMDGRKK